MKTESPQTGMNLQFAAHKVAMKDDSSCQSLFNLLVCVFADLNTNSCDNLNNMKLELIVSTIYLGEI